MADTDTTPEDEDAGPTTVEPFSVEWDWNDDYCSRELDDVLADLPRTFLDTLEPGFDQQSKDDARQALGEKADEIDTRIDEADDGNSNSAAVDIDALAALVDDLRSAADDLDYCAGSCSCAHDAWEGWGRVWFDDFLAQLGDHVWAVQKESSVKSACYLDNIDDTLEVDGICGKLGSHVQWDRVEATWDGSTLSVVLHDRGPFPKMTFTPLNAEQVKAYRAWSEVECYEPTLASQVLATDPPTLNAALALWERTEDPSDVYHTFDDLLIAVTTVGAGNIAELDTKVTARLAQTWKGSTADLLRTGLAVSSPQVLAFAA